MTTVKTPWWHGKRGEWYVVAQVGLIAVVFFGPREFPYLSDWREPFAHFWSVSGGLLMAGGAGLLISGICLLRSKLTPLPYPSPGATLIQTGPYRLVRHPMYAGGVLLAGGWALFVHGGLTGMYAAILLVFAAIKSSREERWLVERFPEYKGYQQRVRRLIPFIY